MSQENIEKFLKLYSNILLWGFIISMVVVAIVYLTNPSAQTYEVQSPTEQAQSWMQVNGSSFQKISYGEFVQIRNKNNLLAGIAFVCIIGIVLSNSDKRRRLKEMYKKLSRGKK